MKNPEQGLLVSWKISKDNPVVMRGRVLEHDGHTALVQSNGNTFEVELTKLRVFYACAYCGKRIASARAQHRHCSRKCYLKTKERQYEDFLFQAIVDYKAAFDGKSPTADIITERTGLSENTIIKAMRRLVKAGRIQFHGSYRTRSIIVVGGHWAYDGLAPEYKVFWC